ncbi:MAG: M13 family peptidase, partial [Candidatus Sulfotelmatobacter sp.]
MKSTLKFSTFSIVCATACALAGLAQNVRAEELHGIVAANIDRTVKPGDDFYLYANGAWIKRAQIPADRAGVDVWTKLEDLSNKRTSVLIAEMAKSNAPAGSKERKVADLYNSYMDEATIEAKGIAPMRPHLDAIAAIRDKKELARALGETLRADVDALNNTNFHTPNLFGLWVAPSFNDSDHYTAYLMQGGLQLPDREYYLSDSEHMKKTRDAYLAHVSTMLKLAGFSDTD